MPDYLVGKSSTCMQVSREPANWQMVLSNYITVSMVWEITEWGWRIDNFERFFKNKNHSIIWNVISTVNF